MTCSRTHRSSPHKTHSIMAESHVASEKPRELTRTIVIQCSVRDAATQTEERKESAGERKTGARTIARKELRKLQREYIEEKERREKEEREWREAREACKEQIEEDYAQQLVEVRYKRVNKYKGEHALALLEEERKEEEEDRRELQNMIAQYKIDYKEKLLEQDKKKRENDRRLAIQQEFIRRKPAIEDEVKRQHQQQKAEFNRLKEQGEKVAKGIGERPESNEWARRRRIRERAEKCKREELQREETKAAHAVARLPRSKPPTDSDSSAAHEKEQVRQRANNNKQRAPTQARQNAWEVVDPMLHKETNEDFKKRKEEERQRCVDAPLLSGQWTPRTPERYE